MAPNLLGHGFRRGTDFAVGNLAKDIQPYFVNAHYDIIMGHSLGGAVLAELLPFLPQSRPISIILVDPALEPNPDEADMARRYFSEGCKCQTSRGLSGRQPELDTRGCHHASYRFAHA